MQKSTDTDYNSFANSEDPDKTNSLKLRSGSALFAILHQQFELHSAVNHVRLMQVKCDKDNIYQNINELKKEN